MKFKIGDEVILYRQTKKSIKECGLILNDAFNRIYTIKEMTPGWEEKRIVIVGYDETWYCLEEDLKPVERILNYTEKWF